MTFIETTQDRGKLVELIQKAQDQVLYPTGKQQSLGQPPAAPEVFSPNTIRLDLSIPDCAPLHFVDLPGVIATVSKDQPEYYVNLVKSLAEIHARNENNIILLTLPTNYDTSNSNSYSIIQRQDAQSRTMAVFTKADLCRDEERDDVLRRYFGEGGHAEEEEEFEYGNHIVMLRDTAGSVERVKEAEQKFFSESPWNSLSDATKKCLGVAALSDRIRDILFSKTAENLPANLDQIRARAIVIQAELDDMPAPPDMTALPYDLRAYMSNFETNMRQLFNQPSEASSARSTLIDCMAKFDEKVQKNSKPTLKVKTAFEVKSQEKARREAAGEGSGAGVIEHDNSVNNGIPATPAKSEITLKHTGSHCFHLERVRQINKDHNSTCSPGDIEPKAVLAMQRLAVANWDKLLNDFMREVKIAVKSEVSHCVHATFAPIEHLPAYKRICEITDGYLNAVMNQEGGRLQSLCDSERSHPLTFDDTNSKTRQSYDFLRQKRDEVRLEVEKDVRRAANLTHKPKSKEPTMADLGVDEWDLEVQMVAKTRAYFEVASRRFVDTICLNIFAQLVPRCEADLANHVKNEIGLNNIAENRAFLAEIMTEDPEREALRRTKNSELERLKTGYEYINTVLETLQRQSGGTVQFMDLDSSPIF